MADHTEIEWTDAIHYIEHFLDIVGVGSSILPAPTIQALEIEGLEYEDAKLSPGSANLLHRFWSKVDIREENECWPWTAAKTGNGYGNFKAGRYLNIPSHRIAYWFSSGVYPDKLLVRHKCDNPVCCNPAHPQRTGGAL